MSVQKKGWDQELMMGLFTKEATYDAGTAILDANACSMKGFELDVEWPDVVANDKDEVTGAEHGTDQALVEQRTKFTYKEPKAKPNSVAGIAALVLGSVTSTQDGTEIAYKHKITPAAVGAALPSIQLEHKKGGVQYAYTGVKGNSLKLSGEEGGFVALEAELMGSGSRAASATAFASKISESWLKCNQMKAWYEDGSSISIDATLTQGAENISVGTPTDIAARLKSFEFSYNNNNEEQPGFGGGGVLQDIDKGRRSIEFKATLRFADATELNHFISQDALAIELDLKGAQITGASTIYYGMQLIIPRGKLKAAPLPQGGVGDSLTIDLELDVQDDGTNDPVIIECYNAQAGYLA